MKLSFISSRQSFLLLFIIILIASLFTLYFFNYVEKRKDDLIKRNFGQLNAITTKIQQRVNGLSSAITSSTQKRTINEDSLKHQLYNLISDLRNVEVVTANNINQKNERDNIRFESDNDSLFIEFSKVIGGFEITLKKSGINEILEKKKNHDLFDDFFLVSDEGSNVIQVPENIITITQIDSLISLDGKATNYKELSKRDAVAEFTTGNQDYLLFIHPMHLFTSIEGPQNQWIICGVVRQDKFRSESFAISSNVILLFLVIIFLIVLAWPLLKLQFVSRYGHIRTYDITIASLSITFAAAILTFTIMDFIVYDKLNQEVDQHLETLSSEIQNNFLNEICLVHSELDNISELIRIKLKRSGDPGIYNLFSKGSGYVKQDTTLTKYEPEYKYFDLMHWSDLNGNQQFKYLMKDKRTPFINISKRKYFQNILDKNAWGNICSHPSEIFIQPVISITTGDFSVSLSKETEIKEGEKYIGAVDFLPASVYSTVLPAGFSFCIIDKNGDVLFHSNNDRNLVENFLDETDNSKFLSAAISSRTKERITTSYWGKTSRVLINPIKGLP
ncbi:MAG TPA: cache domain-containing protein, partial [Ignavibacteriaceae bacterium]|nr:cache domain-containing protein [Ignavibacteriaceae bacterium]